MASITCSTCLPPTPSQQQSTCFASTPSPSCARCNTGSKCMRWACWRYKGPREAGIQAHKGGRRCRGEHSNGRAGQRAKYSVRGRNEMIQAGGPATAAVAACGFTCARPARPWQRAPEWPRSLTPACPAHACSCRLWEEGGEGGRGGQVRRRWAGMPQDGPRSLLPGSSASSPRTHRARSLHEGEARRVQVCVGGRGVEAKEGSG